MIWGLSILILACVAFGYVIYLHFKEQRRRADTKENEIMLFFDLMSKLEASDQATIEVFASLKSYKELCTINKKLKKAIKKHKI